MIRPVCVIVLILSFNFSFGQSNIDVLHYKFNLLLKDQNDTIVGMAGIKLKFLRPSDSFQINLAAQNSDGKGMKVDMIITSLMDSLRFRQQNDEVENGQHQHERHELHEHAGCPLRLAHGHDEFKSQIAISEAMTRVTIGLPCAGTPA